MVKFADLPKLHDECEVSPIEMYGNEQVIYQHVRIIKDNLTGETRLLSTIRVKSDVHDWISDNLPYKRDVSHWFNVTEAELEYCTG